MWRSEDNLHELVFSFHHTGSGDPTQVIRLGNMCFDLLSPVVAPIQKI